MNIDRNNYEEFFILYLDNELSASDRRLVEEFAAANPDLQAELDLLMQSKLTPDMDITFSGKDALLKTENELSAGTTSMLLYIDQELPSSEKTSFEQWLAQNPAAQKELNLLQQTKLQPEHIVFPYKESLYRQEERRVIPIRWWRMAAAAVLLLGISSAAFMFNQNRQAKTGLAETGNTEKASIAQTNGATTKKTASSQVEPAQTDQAAVTPNGTEHSNTEPNNTSADHIHQSVNGTTDIAPSSRSNKHNTDAGQQTATTGSDQAPANNSFQEENEYVVAKRTQINELVNSTSYSSGEFAADPSLTVHKQINPLPAVTQEDDQSLDIIDDESGKKNRHRGFFRKITRTFEKRTNIKATDGDDRLLVGGLAIKF
ncbi:MAG: hypothetical protein J7527_04330 [Chitinophagaceae bacterium]|nr:hypothetical protein [Chitinophagaceae bacterium]